MEVPMQATLVILACCGAPVGCVHTIDIVLVIAIGPITALVVNAGGFHALQVALAARVHMGVVVEIVAAFAPGAPAVAGGSGGGAGGAGGGAGESCAEASDTRPSSAATENLYAIADTKCCSSVLFSS
eukprot:CAMPEP_0177173424 /NCGR_PEP_ID=MMETSP0367-20130122/11650_1 /TAXON_ID=447022 ORGANISM="Scrippsiella hangoei-like, Strain SHHI-4" /NCGR_SAMPLE_ID=MMETSP0367 /ASSEMBLY_ACC=CAM_ASM_000362 /LENGTH=127 /DNA_ID=CAMNT_0018619739 /DNA_START=616 /DNA_END=997 /DNA_ORIENTATION=-